MQYGGCEVRRMTPKLGQGYASPDAGRKNPTGQRPEWNRLVSKLLLLIYSGGVYRWNKKTPSKDCHDSNSNNIYFFRRSEHAH